MKSFHEQFQECVEQKLVENRRLDTPISEVAVFQGKSIEISRILWCNRFDKQCMSSTCKEWRERLDRE